MNLFKYLDIKIFKAILSEFNHGGNVSNNQFDSELDCQGLNCPLPILKTKKAMDGLSSGQILKMMATDPGSVNDVQSWSKRTGNPLMDHSEDNGVYSFLIQRKSFFCS